MAHFSNDIFPPASPVSASHAFFANRIASMIAGFKAKRAARSDIASLLEQTDAELADIGLLRADLTEGLFEEAIDSQAQAMLRVYR